MNKTPITRRFVRQKVLQTLYAFELNGESLDKTMKYVLEDLVFDDVEDEKFYKDLVYKCVANFKEFDDQIKKYLENWDIERISKIDKNLLRMGLCEFLYFPEIPPKATINEIIEVAKLFGASSSGKFINGILDSLLNDLKAQNRLNKSGRGLIEETVRQKKND